MKHRGTDRSESFVWSSKDSRPVKEAVGVIDNEVRDPYGYGNDIPPGAGICPFGPFGYVEEIHGDLGRPMPEYVPTKHELLLLARHWAKVVTDIEYFWSDFGQVGSSDMRNHVYGHHRVSKLSDLVGVEEIRKIFKELERPSEETTSDPMDTEEVFEGLEGDPENE